MRLENLDQKYCHNVSWVSIKAFVVFLSLENVYQISALHGYAGDIVDIVLPFLLMIWWVWYLEILLVSLVIHTHEPELGKTVFKTDAV